MLRGEPRSGGAYLFDEAVDLAAQDLRLLRQLAGGFQDLAGRGAGLRGRLGDAGDVAVDLLGAAGGLLDVARDLLRRRALFLDGGSDAAGDRLGPASNGFWRDHKSSKVNGIRTRTLIEKCDVAVVRFGEKYRQWNAAFDAGYASALGKPVVTLHDPGLTHALKEVDGAAMAVAETPEQVVRILAYAIEGRL